MIRGLPLITRNLSVRLQSRIEKVDCFAVLASVLLCVPSLALGQNEVEAAAAVGTVQRADDAAAIHVRPFLQHATPTSIWIVWEATAAVESVVEWGPTPALGRTTLAAPLASEEGNVIYQAQLTGLRPGGRFYYRVRSGTAASAQHDFRLPPPRGRLAPFQFVVLSDTQADGSNPRKLVETTNDGIIRYAREQYAADLSQALAFALLAGDLVDQGSVYKQWKNDFFDEIANLLSSVPLYPVFGNHEQDSDNFHKYFNLPTNGSPGFEEHWYYFDYANVRIIGLDTNGGYRNSEQLAWLEATLNATAEAEHIDFVFAQFHHPHKSELWTPGNLDYSGQIIARLEAFTTATGKPSVHFYGHTHGYSRGQSRDHVHLWVNVAAGEGNLDYWGEFPIADYPEYARSYAEYGFVMIEVQPGDDPAFTLRRINRGNEIKPRDNEEMDTVTIRRHNQPPATPQLTAPSAGAKVNPLAAIVQGGAFRDPDGDEHWETQVQVSARSDDFAQPLADVWERFENWYAPPGASGPENGYFSVDTKAGSDITQIELPPLPEDQTLFVRLRYRDSGLAWSGWSPPRPLVTGPSPHGPNLLRNPGGEEGTAGWAIAAGNFEAIKHGACSVDFAPVGGDHVFAAGGVCSDEEAYGEAIQRVDVSGYAERIDDGTFAVYYGGSVRNWSGQDRPTLWLSFEGADGKDLGATAKLTGTTATWTLIAKTVGVPLQTRTIIVHLAGTRNAGTDNDSYFDEVFLRIQRAGLADETTGPASSMPNHGAGDASLPAAEQ